MSDEMSNSTLYLQGDCIAPFLDASRFPIEGGAINGRLCAPIKQLPGSPTCCLPCPATKWTYSDDFFDYITAGEWLNVVGLILIVFMLLSYLVLPEQQTRRHYLSVCLIVSVMFITLGFTVPLAAQPEQCYNEITPNDMYSSTECAWSGAFIIAGSLSAAVWIFIRALSMTLQIVWGFVPGQKFYYFSLAFGWGIPAILFTATMTVTGVSFRFARQCDVNHENSMGDFWGPLMAFAGAAGILQLVTFGYCLRVYLKNLFADQDGNSTGASGSQLPSYQNSVRPQTARAVWRRLKKVLWLQWRGIGIVTVILFDVIIFAVVFVALDGMQANVREDVTKVQPWLMCLAMNPTNKDACLDLVGDWLVGKSTVVAILILLSLAGIQTFLFMTRPSVVPAWIDYFKSKFGNNPEFVSLDARQEAMHANSKQALVNHHYGHENATFEMQKPVIHGGSVRLNLDSKGVMSPSQTIVSSPSETYQSPLHTDRQSPGAPNDLWGRTNRMPPDYNRNHYPQYSPPPARHEPGRSQTPDYFSRHHQQQQQKTVPRPDSSQSIHSERRYQTPPTSFSTPQPSRHSSMRSLNADVREPTFRGGLGLNPPSEAGESEEQEDLTGYHGNFGGRSRRF